jgi:hypothetical protein
MLIQSFSEEEVRKAVFQMEHNKAPGPDGFPAEFYQACWDIIKEDLMALFTEFHSVTLLLYSLNFDTIILVDVVPSDIWSRNGKSVTMQDQSRERTRRIFRQVQALRRVKTLRPVLLYCEV